MEQSNLKYTLDSIDKVIEEYREDLKHGEALERLKKNPDYILVVEGGYIEAEEKKLFKILTDPTGASPYSNEQVQLKLASISDFKRYVGTASYAGTVKMNADRAEDLIIKEEQYRKEVTADYSVDKD